ncbi:STIP1 y and U box-containing protein 1 [Orchesella cincta]|uniref:RING-type E3 ubiquitin transferase n=1 Tax=Orchesella cincta TaxID=48709 RepID=A0A1D2MIN6_ORCCI|nr:STIP1 y and U box-containing protein 1 [Orchesella cincta]
MISFGSFIGAAGFERSRIGVLILRSVKRNTSCLCYQNSDGPISIQVGPFILGSPPYGVAGAKKAIEVREEEIVMKEVDLRFYLTRLVREDKDKQMGKLINGNFNFVCKENGETMTRKALQSKVDEQTAKRLSELDDLFTKLEDIRNNKEVPDYLCGKITLDIMKDPVITPSGITYERSAIEGHLDRIGHTDPTTGVPLTKEQLIPNRALKEAVDYFVEKNEWALL